MIIDIEKINRNKLKRLIKERYPSLTAFMKAANELSYFPENNRHLLSEQKITQALQGSSKKVLKDIVITFCQLNKYPLEELYKADEVEIDKEIMNELAFYKEKVAFYEQKVEDIGELKADIRELKTEKKKLKSKNEELEAENEKLKKEIDSLKAENKNSSSKELPFELINETIIEIDKAIPLLNKIKSSLSSL